MFALEACELLRKVRIMLGSEIVIAHILDSTLWRRHRVGRRLPRATSSVPIGTRLVIYVGGDMDA